MPDNEISRLSRLTAIITMLQSKRLVTAATIAKKFGISIRTVYRDIKALEQAGIPVLTEEGKGYSLMEGYTLPPVAFTESEAHALITAEQLVKTNKDASFVKNYSEAIIKIKALLRYKVTDKVSLLSERVQFRQNPDNQTTSNNLSLIQQAIINFHLLYITYRSETGIVTTRIIEPLALYNTQENWIMIAYCRIRKEDRAFRLDRIEYIKAPGEYFKPHNFTFQQYFEECKKNCDTPDIGLS